MRNRILAVAGLALLAGLATLWFVTNYERVSYKERVDYDTQYVQNWSMMRDISIIMKTVPAVCMSRGSY